MTEIMYEVIDTTQPDGQQVVAVIRGREVTGLRAAWISSLLRKGGWPAIDPPAIIHTQVLFARAVLLSPPQS